MHARVPAPCAQGAESIVLQWHSYLLLGLLPDEPRTPEGETLPAAPPPPPQLPAVTELALGGGCRRGPLPRQRLVANQPQHLVCTLPHAGLR